MAKTLILKGTCIKIGFTRNLDSRAVDVIFILDKDYRWGQLAYGKVLDNPRGWWSTHIRHTLREGVDEIVTVPCQGNKTAKKLLNTFQEE